MLGGTDVDDAAAAAAFLALHEGCELAAPDVGVLNGVSDAVLDREDAALAVLGMASQGDPCSSLRAAGTRGQWLVGESSTRQHPKQRSRYSSAASGFAVTRRDAWVTSRTMSFKLGVNDNRRCKVAWSVLSATPAASSPPWSFGASRASGYVAAQAQQLPLRPSHALPSL